MKPDLQETCKRLFEKIHKELEVEDGYVNNVGECCDWAVEKLTDSVQVAMGYISNECGDMFGRVFLRYTFADNLDDPVQTYGDGEFTPFDFGSAYHAVKELLETFISEYLDELCYLKACILFDTDKPKPKFDTLEVNTNEPLSSYLENMVESYRKGNFDRWKNAARNQR